MDVERKKKKEHALSGLGVCIDTNPQEVICSRGTEIFLIASLGMGLVWVPVQKNVYKTSCIIENKSEA